MPAFTEYGSSFHNGGYDTCIGPDGNLWIVDGSTPAVFKFDTTAFTTTTYSLPNAIQLCSICTDGTYIYATDFNSNSATGNVAIYKITTAGVVSTFFAIAGGSSGSVYFDGTYLWFTDRYSAGGGFRQFNLAGGIVNDYPTTINKGGGLLNDGTYWWSGEADAVTGNGISYALVSAPGAWTNLPQPNTPTRVSALAGGDMWWGDLSPNFYSITPGTFVVTPYSVSGIAATGQLCFDGTNLWATDADPSAGGIWRTTPGAPTVGVFYGFTGGSRGALTILYDAPTQTLWATGNDAGGNNYVFSLTLINPQIVMIL